MKKLNFSSYFFTDNIAPSDFDVVKKHIMLTIFLAFSDFFFVLLGILNILDNDFEHIWLDAIGTVFLSAFLVLAHKKIWLNGINYAYVILMEIILGYLFLSGGVELTGALYLMVLPLPALFMLGFRIGLFITFLNFIGAWTLNHFSPEWYPDYDQVIMHRVFTLYAAVTLLSSVFVLIVGVLEKNFMASHEKLYRSKEDFVRLASVRELFMSVYAHDLRGSIGSMHDIIRLLNERYETMNDAKKQKMLKALLANSVSNLDFMKNFFEWASSPDQEIQYQPVNTNMRELIFNAISVYDQFLQAKNINISTELSVAIIAKVDASLISSVIRNLLSNAINFSEKDSMIVIRTKVEHELFIIEIEDFGVGMEQVKVDELLSTTEEQLSNAIRNNKSGLGFVLCKEFVSKHNGNIQIESEPNQGTLVRINLPLS